MRRAKSHLENAGKWTKKNEGKAGIERKKLTGKVMTILPRKEKYPWIAKNLKIG